MDWTDYDAALFDLDGVVTPTADVHMRAWSQTFTAFLKEYGQNHQGSGDQLVPYTDDDYFEYVDGKPRYDGVRSFLASRDIVLPEGDPSDAADAATVCGLGNRKNVVFEEILQRDGVEAYPGSAALIGDLVARGTKLAVVSSSRNAPKVLAAAGLDHHFPLIVDGAVAAEQGLPGKPAPDTFVFAAHHLGVEVERAVVLEDALSGVAAGRAGNFGLVVGVDRGVGADRLTDNGADIVVTDLEELR